MKRILSGILAVVLLFLLTPAAFAASDEADTAAQTLYEMGLFQGVGKNSAGEPEFDLDRIPNRHEAVTMLVRLLGKEQEAKQGTWTIPFTDVADWARPYVGYAFANGLVAGTSETTYSGDAAVTASQYLTLVLRALGYESGTDFQWDKAWELTDQIGLTDGQYDRNDVPFLRGDVAIVSNNALTASIKGSVQHLADSLGLTVPKKLSADNCEINLLYIDIMQAWRAALLDLRDGFTQVAQSAETAQLGAYTSASYYARQAQSKFTSSRDHAQEAVRLCGSLDSTAKAKSAVTDFIDAFYPEILAYQIVDGDSANLLKFMQLGIKKSEQQNALVDAVNQAMQVWTAPYMN